MAKKTEVKLRSVAITPGRGWREGKAFECTLFYDKDRQKHEEEPYVIYFHDTKERVYGGSEEQALTHTSSICHQ